MYLLAANNPFFQAYSHSDLFGKSIFFALFILSVLSWTLLIFKISLTHKLKKSSKNFEKAFLQKKDQPLNIRFDSSSPSIPYQEIYKNVKQATLEVLNKNRFFISKEDQEDSPQQIYLSDADIEMVWVHAQTSISSTNKSLEKYLFILPTIVSLGPFLGLLGTVWGILVTFSGLANNSFLNNNQVVISGLSMALATTVLGLLVAIPALVAHNYLKSVIKEFRKEMENFSHHLLTTIEMQYRRVDVH